jgi:hypothetical protein
VPIAIEQASSIQLSSRLLFRLKYLKNLFSDLKLWIWAAYCITD